MNDPDDKPVDEKAREREAYVNEKLSADDYFAQDEAGARTASLRKQKQILIGGLAGLALLIALIMYACQPPKGTIMYGLCAAFLERYVAYPPSIQHLQVEQFPRAVRIYFNQTDAFGQFTQDTIECSADPKDFPNIRFDKVLYNRDPVDPKLIQEFNPTIPVVISSDPDLTLPKAPENMLKALPKSED